MSNEKEKKEKRKWRKILLNMDKDQKESQRRFVQAQKAVKMDMRERGRLRESKKDSRSLDSEFRNIWR